jgi:hypothetical protein
MSDRRLGTGRPRLGVAPRFRPDSYGCDNTPESEVAGTWLVSAPRGVPGPTRPRDVVELGVWARNGQPEEHYFVGARVIAPDGSATTATAGATRGGSAANLPYPCDFRGADSLRPGIYTVVWETGGAFIACDGWQVVSY